MMDKPFCGIVNASTQYIVNPPTVLPFLIIHFGLEWLINYANVISYECIYTVHGHPPTVLPFLIIHFGLEWLINYANVISYECIYTVHGQPSYCLTIPYTLWSWMIDKLCQYYIIYGKCIYTVCTWSTLLLYDHSLSSTLV